jgi:hypothetical protein
MAEKFYDVMRKGLTQAPNSQPSGSDDEGGDDDDDDEGDFVHEESIPKPAGSSSSAPPPPHAKVAGAKRPRGPRKPKDPNAPPTKRVRKTAAKASASAANPVPQAQPRGAPPTPVIIEESGWPDFPMLTDPRNVTDVSDLRAGNIGISKPVLTSANGRDFFRVHLRQRVQYQDHGEPSWAPVMFTTKYDSMAFVCDGVRTTAVQAPSFEPGALVPPKRKIMTFKAVYQTPEQSAAQDSVIGALNALHVTIVDFLVANTGNPAWDPNHPELSKTLAALKNSRDTVFPRLVRQGLDVSDPPYFTMRLRASGQDDERVWTHFFETDSQGNTKGQHPVVELQQIQTPWQVEGVFLFSDILIPAFLNCQKKMFLQTRVSQVGLHAYSGLNPQVPETAPVTNMLGAKMTRPTGAMAPITQYQPQSGPHYGS